MWHSGGEVQGGYFANYLHYFYYFTIFYYSTILHSDALLMTTGGGRQGYKGLVLTCMLGNYTQVQVEVEVEAPTYMLDN